MTLALLKTIIAKLRQQVNRKAGFTLVELLVVMVMSTIVISSLLALTNQLNRANHREIARSSTQEEMKRALNYMARELREAVYVYNGAKLTSIRANLPTNLSTNVTTPILAFWKAEPVPYINNQVILTDCTKITDSAQQRDCNNLQVERRSYTLVVYAQSTDNTGNTWKGESRIIRYELRKYNQNDLKATAAKLRRNTGYVDPERDNTTFANWPNDATGQILQGSRPPNGRTDVLVDYVASANKGSPDNCGDFTAELSADEQARGLSYTRSPGGSNNASFYACVLSAADNEGASNNQDVVLYLRGSSEGIFALNQDEFLPSLQTRVIIRSVINKYTN